LSRFPLKQKLHAVGFAFFGLLNVCPGLYFRQHYFVCLVPAIGLLSAINLSGSSSFLARLFKVKNLNFVLPLIVVLSFFIVITRDKEYYLQEEPAEISKRFYNVNPFVESIEIGQFINRNTSPTDRIAVLGSEPEVYFYSDRKSSSGFLYVYPLVENQSYNARMQQEMITEIERSEPKFIVYCNV
jgi:hypothetical protein